MHSFQHRRSRGFRNARFGIELCIGIVVQKYHHHRGDRDPSPSSPKQQRELSISVRLDFVVILSSAGPIAFAAECEGGASLDIPRMDRAPVSPSYRGGSHTDSSVYSCSCVSSVIESCLE